VAYWEIETLERMPDEDDLQPVIRYAEGNDLFSWLRQVQDDEAPKLIVYRGHKAISEQVYREKTE
jgi:hypothetical protein